MKNATPFAAGRPLDVICLGRFAVDFYAQQIGARLEDVTSFAKYLGGSSANTAFGCARLGLKTGLVSRIGDDANGHFLVETIAREGCDVAANYYNSAEEAEALCREIRALGRRACAIAGSVGIPDSVDEIYAEFGKHFDRLDIVVSNAASGVLKPTIEMGLKHWRWCMETNALALNLLTQRGLPLMQPGARIIAMSSLGAQRAMPGYGFIGEEGGNREGADKSHTWIVDPLDGTTNFLHGIPQFAISIGLQREGTVIAGVIYNPANDELYIAERGKGAFLNDQRLRVAGRRKLSDCVVACGLPHIGRGDHELSRLEMAEIQNRVAGLRRFGAASLDMAFVAAGRLDGYWERNLQPWDMAAGHIMVREAGGTVSGIEGNDDPLKTGNVICGNEYIHAELVKILKPLGK